MNPTGPRWGGVLLDEPLALVCSHSSLVREVSDLIGHYILLKDHPEVLDAGAVCVRRDARHDCCDSLGHRRRLATHEATSVTNGLVRSRGPHDYKIGVGYRPIGLEGSFDLGSRFGELGERCNRANW